MKLPRRKFLHLAAGAAALPALPRFARAQAYPTRPVRLVVGFSAGSTGDILGRVLCEWLSKRLGQSFIVENRPGAGTNIATEAVIKSPPDGYSLLWTTTGNAVNATLYEKLNFNFISDIAPIAGVSHTPLLMVVNPSFPARTVPEFISYAKANPGKLNFASGGIGSGGHMAGELFKMLAGVNMTHVNYRGEAPALTDLIGGTVQVMFALTPSSIEHVRTGRLRALATTTATRLQTLPDLLTVGESVPGYQTTSWQGVGAPRQTPADIIDRLNREINAALADPEFRARLADLGVLPFVGSPSEFAKHIAEETERLAKVVKFSGAKAE
jgi:tripartite-type tricarboxylate transporter receptor subunit TctC